MVMIYSKGLLFSLQNVQIKAVSGESRQNFDMRKQRDRGSQPGGAEVGHQAHGKGEADAPQSALKSKVLHSGTKSRWK